MSNKEVFLGRLAWLCVQRGWVLTLKYGPSGDDGWININIGYQCSHYERVESFADMQQLRCCVEEVAFFIVKEAAIKFNELRKKDQTMDKKNSKC